MPDPKPLASGTPTRFKTPAPGEVFASSRSRTRGRGVFWEVLGELASARTAAVLIALIGASTLLASFYERVYGMRAAHVAIYQAWWFTTLWLLVVVAIVGAVVVRWPLKRHQAGFATVHAGLVTIVVGFFLAGNDRLDGMLPVDEGRVASQIELPVDRVVALDQGADESGWYWATFQPLRDAGYPSALRFLLHPVWPTVDPEVAPVDPPRPLFSLKSGVEVRLAAVCATAAPDIAWVPGDGPGTRPVAHLSLAVRPPMAKEFRPFTETWMAEADGSQLHEASRLATATFRETASDELVADFLAGPAAAGRRGVLTFYPAAGRRVAVDLDAVTLPHATDLGDGRTLTVTRVIANPGPGPDGDLAEDDRQPANPGVEFQLAGPGSATRTILAFAYLPARRAADGDLDYLYRAPQQVDPAEGSGQGVFLQLLAGPDHRLHLRSFSRTAGAGPVVSIPAEAGGWSGELAAGATGAMTLRATVEWMPRAVSSPRPIHVPAGKKDEAMRWVQLELGMPGGPVARRWFARGDRASVTVPGHGDVIVQYSQAIRDLKDPPSGFAVRLDRFENGKDPGGGGNATFASEVTIIDSPAAGAGDGGSPALVTMNEPLTVRGVTLYQTSFSQWRDADGIERTTSVFTVAEDRGRPLKYLGSLLLVAGALWWYLGRRR